MKTLYPPQAKIDAMDDLPHEDVKLIVVHHSATPMNTTVQSIYDYHVNVRGWLGGGYHFCIEPNGTVTQMRPTNKVGSHCPTKGTNFKSIGCCFIGNYEAGDKVTPQAWSAFSELARTLFAEFGLDESHITYHSACGGQTECPGDNLIEQLKQPLAPKVEVDDTHTCSLKDFSTGELVDELSVRIKAL